MKIDIICTGKEHPIYPHLKRWQKQQQQKNHQVRIANSSKELDLSNEKGDFLFLISCTELIQKNFRDNYKFVLVVHASDLPKGRGWSPYVWQVLEGAKRIPLTLLEAEDKVDSGRIWAQEFLDLEGHELFDEIHDKLGKCTISLMTKAVNQFKEIIPRKQRDEEPTYYKKRTPDSSRIDPAKDILSQFNLLRVADPKRYPCFFEHCGYKYQIQLKKLKTNPKIIDLPDNKYLSDKKVTP